MQPCYFLSSWSLNPTSFARSFPAGATLQVPSCKRQRSQNRKAVRQFLPQFVCTYWGWRAHHVTDGIRTGGPKKQPKIHGFHWGYSPKKGVSLFQLVFGGPPCRPKGSPKTQPACGVERTRPSHGPQQSPFGRSTLWWFVDWKIHGSNMGYPMPK